MISLHRYLAALQTAMGNRQLDLEQSAVVSHPPDTALIVVAGPGTGKTTAIIARALKLAFVDGWDPGSIMLTTFTKKAAAEMRSRLLGWGIGVREELGNGNSNAERVFLEGLDINKFLTGTLDSLAEQILSEHRPVNTSPPVVLDQFIANGVLMRSGLFENSLWRDADLHAFASMHNIRSGPNGPTIRDLLSLCRIYTDRAVHDLIDLKQFSSIDGPHHAIATVISQYQAGLNDLGPGIVDFALLEWQLYEQLRSGALDGFLDGIRSIFVDEYQDTNALQEAIYATIALRTGESITIVGDDDQSLYRFRGGTVELFSSVQQRLQRALGSNAPAVLYLSTNYRASKELVEFVNDFVALDPEYQPSRVPNKPDLNGPKVYSGLPVLGLFRQDIQDLADDLSELLDSLFNQGSVVLDTDAGNFRVTIPSEGMPGDCALLSFSVRERTSWNRFGGGGQPRLPLLLRESLGQLSNPIKVFNPRGQPLHQVQEVQRLCGLMLECIDPVSATQKSVNNLGGQVTDILDQWRREALKYLASNPAPASPRSLQDFVASWQSRTPQLGGQWPDSVPLLDLCYQLSTWIPSLHEEPEKQIFLEVIGRAITQSTTLNRFRSRIVTDPQQLESPSILQALRYIFSPIAMGDISIDEELLEEFPRDAINVLTIHQAKGLEFPVVIVDVAAHFKNNHQAHRRMRFPEDPDWTHIAEDLTTPYSGLSSGNFRHWRDRAFDDLVRRYFVAYSRPQALLLLVGLNAARPGGRIRNVALGWDRQGISQWTGGGTPYLEIQSIEPGVP